MAEKTLNARVITKNDTKANWDKATNFVPKKGEPIVYTDLLKVKVGDGETTVVNLPYANENGELHLVLGPATDTTAGTWTGTIDGLTSYYEGLVVVYIPHVAGASTTKLNINGLGAKLCTWRDAAKMSTQYAVGSAICMVYRNDLNNNTGGFQALSDYYQNNTNQTVKVGTTTFGANDAVELVAGDNITLTPNTANKTITISSSGGPSPSTITFSISGVNYSAENGMTWGEWLISKYNTSSIAFKWPTTTIAAITTPVGDYLYNTNYEEQTLATPIESGEVYLIE